MDDDVVDQFVALTGASEAVARQILEITNGDLSQAATLYFDNPDEFNQPSASSGPAPTDLATMEGVFRRPAHRGAPPRPQGARETIHIESDDDLDDDLAFGEVEEVSAIARTAQLAEDAAMAKRLQEELYAENATTSDGVRAPIARTTETLVGPVYGMDPGADDLNMEQSVLDQLRRRRHARPPPTANPFAQNVWDDDTPSRVENGEGSQQTMLQARLAELFRPPHDLMSHLPWDEARAEGREEKKWILANIQDISDFWCQVLNRDIWKDEAIRQIVREHFIFLQYQKDDPQASQYIQYYMPEGRHENPDNYPHVAIIDPRTGEQVKVWSGRPFPDAPDFHSQLVEFLDRYSLDAHSKNPVAKSKPRQPVKDIGRMTEEEMLQMAMQNSLETGDGGGPSQPSVLDPDQLTAPRRESQEGSVVDLTDSPAATPQSAFARIASDRPHVEPANDPASTTRIQLRHSGGRVIRRFAVDDPVVRVYEWLKAEPLEGKSGSEFELKVMPQGRDLIDDLDKTIAEAGLKQATVMIEFVD